MSLASASGPLSMGKGAYVARHPAVFALLQEHEWLGKRLSALTSLQSRLHARWDGAVNAVENARDVSLEAHAALTEARNRRFEAGGADPKQISAAESQVADAKALLEDAAETARAATVGSANTRTAMNAVNTVLGKLATRKVKIRRLEASLPKGRTDDIAHAQRATIANLLAKRERTENAPPPRDEAEAALILQASEMAKGPGIILNAKGARLTIPETHASLANGPSGGLSGVIPVPDTAALFAWANLDIIIEHIKDTLDLRYGSIDIALDQRAKREALASIDAEILACERLEVEAILATVATGLDIGLRADTSVWALLGIGPVAGIDEEYNDGLPGTARLN
jgi:hypothetical protein